ncbi:hypothetical protein F5984_19885 [Rudanella paleaurantiibacter]|uniref:Uncharacterized protein n=1 Tax=Rudanella paleaurantiibacter TaxID=2614655 RepID=A0A7J5TV36_9BACT|nr:hypothetical protein [Rudanella paleaurantiibacter]KAB7728018.1 hypothetical protein F5984_19885 [Rudanella paleaurantiibacter]
MREHFIVENKEAASPSEAAFILEPKSGLRAEVLRFRSLRQMDEYQPDGSVAQVRNLPILLVSNTPGITESKRLGILKRMASWYYYTQLMPKPTDTQPPSESAG